MLSDESSSDSETGRFKCRSKPQDDQEQRSNRKEDLKSSGRNRRPESDRYRRDLDRKRDDRNNSDRRSRERHRYSRHSPIRRRHSRERSRPRRSQERGRHDRDSRGRSKPLDHRSNSRDRHKSSRGRSHRSPLPTRDIKGEIKGIISRRRSTEKVDSREKEKKSSSPEKEKRSEVHKPSASETKKVSVPVVVDDTVESDGSVEVQPGSYYNMIPAIVKGKSEESSEIDSSDDERLRAKLLNLEKELHKSKRKKHKKKHKKKNVKSDKEKGDAPVEVSSTTDIQDNVKTEIINLSDTTEVTSTQKGNQKDSSEEGEILSDDSDQINIDPTDLRHKLKRSSRKSDTNSQDNPNKDVCGPALPPHLAKRFRQSTSPDVEGPALPPPVERSKNIGPSIPDDMRKVLADQSKDVVKYESSDEDGIGPLPAGADTKLSEAHQRLEERALEMKIRSIEGHSLNDSKVKSREQWMLELPEGKAKYLGLEARSFRAKEGPDMSDRSAWTDTPEEKARKAAGTAKEEDPDVTLQREARARHIANRDEEQEKSVKKHKKKHKRDESLLEMHQKKLKKKKKKEERDEEKKERRPFNRDIDLQANRFDEAQKKSIIKKAQDLNSRFSRGEAKFL